MNIYDEALLVVSTCDYRGIIMMSLHENHQTHEWSVQVDN